MVELDRVYRALAAEERRLALACLDHHRQLTLPDLAELVVERQYDTGVAALSGEQLRDTYFRLYHTHIPLLEECGLVQYSQEDDLVAATDRLQTALDSVEENVERLQSFPTDSIGD
ncbi:hypothetical protein NDI85_12120 [Halomicroarcula sp. S1AR25-4]|uniref:DUF7344 domain-containing protein n=1 Tax=Haloarcula sp. S1AR25-4 TaxID=2950538 RepID=UPI0028751919|nr:hypothetical protein [Halomicroarcula sp. S1AR25-4]MDS0278544.1 hypothetical protein [Halomicroarcula sp. S1AR25-4]